MKKAYFTIAASVLLIIVLSLILSIYNRVHTLESQIVHMVKEIINESNYYSENEQPYHINRKVGYKIYSKDEYYFLILDDDNYSYTFSAYKNNIYYVGGNEDYQNSKLVCSGHFTIDDVYQPDYSLNDNPRITNPYNYDIVCQSIIYNYIKDGFYTVYILNHFSWDKSNYLNGAEMLDIMIIDRNSGDVFVSYAYFLANGWNVGMPGYSFNTSQYPELVQKYMDTSVYSKNAFYIKH